MRTNIVEGGWLLLSNGNNAELRGLLAYFTLFVILPFVHLYTYQTAIGSLPFVSGVIPLLTLVGVTPLLVFSIRSLLISNLIVKWSIFFLLYVLVYVLLLHSLGPIVGTNIDGVLFSYNMLIVYKCFVFLLVGFSLGNAFRYRAITIVIWLFMVVNALLNVGYGSVFVNLDGVDEEISGLYLFLGDSFALWSILAVSSVRPFSYRVVVILITAVALFVLSSRTSLYAFLVSIFLIMTQLVVGKKNASMRLLFIVGTFGIALTLVANQFGADDILDGRMFQFLTAGEDSSWDFRDWQLEAGIEHIKESPFFGAYGSQVRLLGRIGDYIHNFLEIWRQFGLIPFSIIFVLGVALLISTVKSIRFEMEDFAIFYSGVVVFVLVEVVFSRSWGTPYIFLALGLSNISRLNREVC